MSRRTRTAAVVVVVVAVIAAAALWIDARTTADDGPGGTAALERLLDAVGTERREAGRPSEGTFVVFTDRRDKEEAEAVLEWVEAGGRLVLADPDSPIADELDVHPQAAFRGVFGGSERIRPDCAVPEVAGVRQVATRSPRLLPDVAERPTVGCFPGSAGTHLRVVPHGDGRVLALADRSPLTNELLDEADNALFALRLLDADAGPVVFGLPRPVDAPGSSLPQLLPAGATTTGLGLVLALLVFVAARGRRLGLSPEETTPSPLPADALVRATAALYRNAGDRAHTTTLLRHGMIRRVRRRLGLPAHAEPAAVVQQLRAVGMTDAEHLLRGDPPTDDEQLIRLAAEAERGVRELERMPR